MERISIDTTLLIDLQRERNGSKGDGSAHEFLRIHGDAAIVVSSVVLGEYAEGFEPGRMEEAIAPIIQSCEILSIDVDTTLVYASLSRDLRKRGLLIGANDLWIAASSIRYEIVLATRNDSHFSRVPGLRLIHY